MDWKNKVVVITGATGGIGEAISRVIDVRGAQIVLGSRNEEEWKRMSSRLSDRAGWSALDVSDPYAVKSFFAGVEKEFGPVDVLINNAGFGLFAEFADADPEDYRRMMEVNYLGTVYCTKAVLPAMLERNSGTIINIASLAGKVATPKSAGYAASKFAVLGFTNALRMELDGKGVHVGAVNPGPVETKFFEKADPSGNYVKNVKRWMIKPDDVAMAVVKMIEDKIEETDLPSDLRLLTRIHALAPRLMDKVSKSLLNQK